MSTNALTTSIRKIAPPKKTGNWPDKLFDKLLPKKLAEEARAAEAHIREGRFQRSLAFLAGTSSVLAGAATAACGPIGFVGLVVPHLARRLGGVDYRWVVPYSGLLGGLLVLSADIIGRLVVRPAELQVGIVMALIGGPAFVLLVRRTRMVRI